MKAKKMHQNAVQLLVKRQLVSRTVTMKMTIQVKMTQVKALQKMLMDMKRKGQKDQEGQPEPPRKWKD